MWLNEHVEAQEQEPEKEIHEIDPKVAKMIQESLHGNFGGDLRNSAQKGGKVMLTGAILGVMAAVYLGKSPLYLGLGGAVLAKLISKQ